jgi:MerR family transcriptional regulator, thiopeptide resistance regulator
VDDHLAGPLTVGRVAELAGVTVRTLHHYDEIGLVRPSRRTAAGYRAYSAADVERLRQVLVYRRLGFGLREVAEMVSDASADMVAHLRRQRELVAAQRDHMDALVAAIDKELEARVMGIGLTPQEQLEVFGTSRPGGEWADEAQERWGSTDPYQESSRRASAYSIQDWRQVKAEADENTAAFAAALRAGSPASGPGPVDLAERHRQHICRNFYDCDYGMHRALATMYLADPRFASTYDGIEPGLAQYVHDAIGANADRQQAS